VRIPPAIVFGESVNPLLNRDLQSRVPRANKRLGEASHYHRRWSGSLWRHVTRHRAVCIREPPQHQERVIGRLKNQAIFPLNHSFPPPIHKKNPIHLANPESEEAQKMTIPIRSSAIPIQPAFSLPDSRAVATASSDIS
jgi:hypothetical protein